MLAVFKRDLYAYFTGPTGYVFLAVFFAVNGAAFSLFTLQAGVISGLNTYFTTVIILLAFVIPILTMKTFSEEKRQRTEQLLLTSPISLGGLVFGKFLSVFVVFAGAFLLSTAFHSLVLYPFASDVLFEPGVVYTAAERSAIVGSYFVRYIGPAIAVLLVGAAFTAVGVFVSALTENQVIAVLGTVSILLVFLATTLLSPYIPFAPIRAMLDWVSIYSRFTNFVYGIFDFNAILYYASISFVFQFLTVRVYEKRRWA